ncbi:MAG: glycosyltransferase family 39 protein [Taibaiella sp.]|nr:glycosyltransferase family 39 protein [Taibaiella sp.]
MRLRINKPEKAAGLVTIIALGAMMGWGIVSVWFEVRPFWVDEWRIIYNLKFKSVPEIWGRLAFMQQFPRTYLSLLKFFTASFDYSYFSLRLPSFIIAVVAMLSSYQLAGRLFSKYNYNRFLLVLMLVSCGTFTEYFVQIKQYTMDLLLCVAALWQMVYLLEAVATGRKGSIAGYLLLCFSFLIAPFFSYTYPLAIAPVYVVLLVQHIGYWKTEKATQDKIKTILRQWLPLFLCTFSITLFYFVDVAQLTADKDMEGYWGHLMLKKGFDFRFFLGNIFHLLAQAGSGLLFWWLFGLLGTAALLYGIYKSSRMVSQSQHSLRDLAGLYSVLLILLLIGLYILGKLPMGEPRLNAFAIPAISILLILLLDAVADRGGKVLVVSQVITVILYAGLAGNVFSTIVASFTDGKYARRMQIYRSTQKAISIANEKKLPILITPDVAYPYEKTQNLPFANTVPGDWVLMTFPAYKAGESQPVYAIDDTAHIDEYLKQLPAGVKEVMAGDGVNYRIVKASD